MIMMDEPYTLPDEDPFSTQSVLQQRHETRNRHKRSSLLDSWISDGLLGTGLGSSSNPYLAYPDLPRPRDRADSCSSYDLIDDDDIPEKPFDRPNKKLSTSPRSFISLLTPPRNKSRHTRSPSSSDTITSPTPKRILRHTASQSLSCIPDTLALPPLPPPRPSFSSSTSSLRSRTYPHSMSTATFDSDSAIGLPDTPTKSIHSFFSSLRRQNRSSATLSSPSKDTLTTQARALSPKRPYPTHTLSNIPDVDNDEDSNIDNLDFLPPPSHRFSRASSQTSASASSSYLPSASQSHLPTKPSKRDRDRYFASITSRSSKKKRKLIISGIAASEVRKFDGVKRWCESFGELRSITRLPNGDLQIDFRDADVADTVCRIRAKVFIAGVGSVQLSWIIGNKR